MLGVQPRSIGCSSESNGRFVWGCEFDMRCMSCVFTSVLFGLSLTLDSCMISKVESIFVG